MVVHLRLLCCRRPTESIFYSCTNSLYINNGHRCGVADVRAHARREGSFGPAGAANCSCSPGWWRKAGVDDHCFACPEFATSPGGLSNLTNCTCMYPWEGENGGTCSVQTFVWRFYPLGGEQSQPGPPQLFAPSLASFYSLPPDIRDPKPSLGYDPTFPLYPDWKHSTLGFRLGCALLRFD